MNNNIKYMIFQLILKLIISIQQVIKYIQEFIPFPLNTFHPNYYYLAKPRTVDSSAVVVTQSRPESNREESNQTELDCSFVARQRVKRASAKR